MVTFWTAKIEHFFETEKRNGIFFLFSLFFIRKEEKLSPCFRGTSVAEGVTNT